MGIKKFLVVVFFLLGAVWSFAQESKEPPYKDKLQQVESFLRNGNLREGLDILEQITKDYPQAAEVFYAKGLLYGQSGNMEEAIANARKAYELEKSNLAFSNLLMDIYKRQGMFEEAILLVKNLKNFYPKAEGLDRELLLLYTQNNQLDKAEAHYQAMAKTQHSDTLDLVMAEIYLNKNEHAKAKTLLQPLNGKTKIADIYAYLSYIHNREGKQKEAISTIEQGIKITNDKSLYLDLADLYKDQGKTEPMFAALKEGFTATTTSFDDKYRVLANLVYNEKVLSDTKLIQLADVLVLNHPDMLAAQVIRGELFWRKGNVEDARTIFLKVVNSNVRYVDAWRLLINTDLALNQPDEGIKHSQEALRHNPNNSQLLYFSALAHIAKSDWQKGREVLETALNFSENENSYLRSMIYGTLGDVYHQLNEKDLSDVAYEEAIALDSTNVGALNNYAYYLAQRKKDLHRAERFSKLSNDLEPNSATLMDTYAWVLFQQGKFREALSWIEKAVKMETNSAVLFDHYGDILIKLGKEKEALKQWQKALEIYMANAEENAANIDKIKTKISGKKYVE